MIRKTLIAMVLGSAVALAAGTAGAQAKVPSTAEDHYAMAKKFQDEADAARKQAAEHREMVAAIKKGATNAHEKQGQRDPAVTKMERHCAALVVAAERLASASQKAADFHTLRGKELQGK